jgi:hypothetical protein
MPPDGPDEQVPVDAYVVSVVPPEQVGDGGVLQVIVRQGSGAHAAWPAHPNGQGVVLDVKVHVPALQLPVDVCSEPLVQIGFGGMQVIPAQGSGIHAPPEHSYEQICGVAV